MATEAADKLRTAIFMPLQYQLLQPQHSCTLCWAAEQPVCLLYALPGDVWHVAIEGLPGSGVYYALRVSGNGGWETGYRWDSSRLLLDPRAPLVAGRRAWAVRDELEEFQTDVSAYVQYTALYSGLYLGNNQQAEGQGASEPAVHHMSASVAGAGCWMVSFSRMSGSCEIDEAS
eukprot:GHRR01025839.1.p1 GENE.GHRR01025839.1~~GHRR01025839.1.p1  ORF type:complete len:174 (+),score=41.95 GHRR01025839.1:232-753(+)